MKFKVGDPVFMPFLGERVGIAGVVAWVNKDGTYDVFHGEPDGSFSSVGLEDDDLFLIEDCLGKDATICGLNVALQAVNEEYESSIICDAEDE